METENRAPSAPPAAISAEAFARELVERFVRYEQRSLNAAAKEVMVEGQIAKEEAAELWCDAADEVRDLAAKHGIKL